MLVTTLFLIVRKRDKAPRPSPWRGGPATSKNRGVSPRRFRHRFLIGSGRDQRSNCSTLCCDWLASASAETAIDCRVDNAWLFAASSLVSASVRLDEPVCSTLIRFFEKS